MGPNVQPRPEADGKFERKFERRKTELKEDRTKRKGRAKEIRTRCRSQSELSWCGARSGPTSACARRLRGLGFAGSAARANSYAARRSTACCAGCRTWLPK